MCPSPDTPATTTSVAPLLHGAAHFDPATCNGRTLYQLLTGGVVPRPIAWISTMNRAGVTNLAPFSFFTVVSIDPPIFAVTQVYPGPHRKNKDTVVNLIDTNECVVNVVSEGMAATMNATCAEYPPGTSEMDVLGVKAVASSVVRVPGVARSAVRFECTLRDTMDIGNGRVMLLNVVHIAVDKAVLGPDGASIDSTLTHLVGRLGGDAYTRTNDQLTIKRPTAL
ncbi:hypothetical protein H257_16629 [Aphanomyces astaci]|uniref:Flavin reductase like domain-containing protein n=1 Tax=Aphanomyces astaci TaxID=112090 RepID=W4FHZ3_APHAT|nr:hypothetical protein H257_16629 [Aphanomyces astaci]ETV67075.1 hypothetical protein H257_16629 [Aphanomyces astaci]|eukprot:XP_009843444.1 hypothetical protein H257_16629 [Aphanomyces astaci]